VAPDEPIATTTVARARQKPAMGFMSDTSRFGSLHQFDPAMAAKLLAM
jgi:hypothetical protein